MQKIDFKKTMKEAFNASVKKVSFVEIPEMQYLMVEGKGYPENNTSYQQSFEALYGVAYTLKFMLKFNESIRPKKYCDYVIPPFGTQWWMAEGDFDIKKADLWRWNNLLMQPDFITPELIEMAKSELKKKKNVASLNLLKFEKFYEGRVAQMMHIGPYSEVSRVAKQIILEIESRGYKLHGRHHEIYFNDPRKTAPEKLKTLVRIPYL
jgi:hypothetical protein